MSKASKKVRTASQFLAKFAAEVRMAFAETARVMDYRSPDQKAQDAVEGRP